MMGKATLGNCYDQRLEALVSPNGKGRMRLVLRGTAWGYGGDVLPMPALKGARRVDYLGARFDRLENGGGTVWPGGYMGAVLAAPEGVPLHSPEALRAIGRALDAAGLHCDKVTARWSVDGLQPVTLQRRQNWGA